MTLYDTTVVPVEHEIIRGDEVTFDDGISRGYVLALYRDWAWVVYGDREKPDLITLKKEELTRIGFEVNERYRFKKAVAEIEYLCVYVDDEVVIFAFKQDNKTTAASTDWVYNYPAYEKVS